MKIHRSICSLAGNTPMLELVGFESGASAKILAKLEYFNPAGSVKDRVAVNMIKSAEDSGAITKDTVIIEPTSGNTGIGLAAVCASLGYKLIIVMPDTMSQERRQLMAAYGATLVLTDGALGMQGAIEMAESLHENTENSVIIGQFTNPNNPMAHYLSTAPEIWQDTEGKTDILVSSVGTGGTISGIGKYLKEKNANIKVVAVEPEGSPYLSRGISGSHKIQGIGAGFVPKTLDLTVIDEIMTVSDDDAVGCAREVAKTDGILVGISSGAALSVARRLAQDPENAGKNIVVILPDTGERYLSSELFEQG